MNVYKHRGYLIGYNQDSRKWFVYDEYFSDEFNSIEQAKNAIDKKLGGYPTRRIPKRWLKDEKLRIEYNK